MINSNNDQTQGFISGLDVLILKNRNDLGIPGSDKFYKSHKNVRNHFLNKWFTLFSGIHTNVETCSNQSTSGELENKIDFYSLLLKLNETRQFDLKSRLENAYNQTIETKHNDVYSIIQFLLTLQNTDNVKLDECYHFEKVDVPSSIRLYGDTRSVNTSETRHQFDFFPKELFIHDSTSKKFINIINDKEDGKEKQRFISDLSNLSTVRSTISDKSSSGYYSKSIDKSTTMITEIKENIDSSIVSYPFSEFCGKSQSFGDYWEKEIIAEWDAFSQGRELPRRFVWEDRGRNVGREKPRITEWRPEKQLNSLAISKAIFMSRYENGDQTNKIRKFLNISAVPITVWIKDVILLRLGISSTTFKYDKTSNCFQLISDMPKYIMEQLDSHIKAGTIFARLSLLIDEKFFTKESLIRDRLIDRLSDIVAMHREVLSNIDCDFASLTDFSGYIYKLTSQIEYLGYLFDVDPVIFQIWPTSMLQNSAMCQGGITLLKHMYETTCSLIAHPFLSLTFYLFEGCFDVVLEQLHQWLYQGQLYDRFYVNQANDFIIESNAKYIANKDYHWWAHGHQLCQITDRSQYPWIFDSLSTDILRCGKSMRLLILIDETNPLIHNSDIVRHRPPLKLSYSFRSDTTKPIIDYVTIVQSVAAQHLQLEHERIAAKEKLDKIKESEAAIVRERFFLKEQENRNNRQIELAKQKNIAFGEVKEAADNAIKLKREKNEQEKMADKALIEKFKDVNRDLIEEIKYDLTILYAQKFADAEARENLSLEKIKIYKEKLLKNVNERDQLEDVNKIISVVVKECVDACLPDTEEAVQDDNVQRYSDTPINNRLIDRNRDHSVQSNDNIKQVNSRGNVPESTAQKAMYPESSTNLNHDTNTIENIKEMSIHGHSSESTVQESLYPSTNPNTRNESRHTDHFKQVNLQGHTADSSVQGSLYPGTNESNLTVVIKPANTHGHSSESTAQESLYPGTNESNLTVEIKPANTHGHSSESTAQESMYPGTNESNLTSDIKPANIHGHPSESSAQESLYPSTNPQSSRESTFVSDFKQINTQGHSSQSTIQEMLYPNIRESAFSKQTNNNSSVVSTFEASVDIDSKSTKETLVSDFVKSFYTIDLKSISASIQRTFVNQSEPKRVSNEPIDLEDELLETLVNRSLMFSIMSHVKLVDAMIINSFLNQFHLRTHLEEIRKYLFLQDGHFSSTLLTSVFSLFSRTKLTASVLHKHKLDDIVKIAVNCSHFSGDCNCSNVSLSLKTSTNTDQVIFNNKLDQFSINYSVKWPLNIVINKKQIRQYQSIFRAILQIKFANWSLSETRQSIKSWYSKSASSGTIDLNSFRPLYSCLTEMEHWIRQIDSCLGNQVSGSGATSWRTFMDNIANGKCSDLDSLIKEHSIYLDEIVIRCLLGGDHTECLSISQPVKKVRTNIRKIIIDILTMICDYQRIIGINHWQCDSPLLPVHVVNNNLIVKSVVNLHKKFKVYVDCLLKVLKGLSQDPYLSYLFVSLDFNHFYYKPQMI